MKEIILSNCEKNFILKSIGEGTRLDGRNLDEWRSLKICFGSDWGSCHVALGNTKVVAHITCKVALPKQTRPNEGILFVNLELGTMGAPNFEANRQSDLNVYLNRLIEKCIRDSRCVDLESLCIVSEEKVWALRIDMHVLNHAGNLIECASIAALTSLAHFKRPDITTNGEEIIIHTLAEKDPIPIVLHHYPVCVSFGIFNNGTVVSDPNLLEETICYNSGALLVVGMNPYREVCLLDLTGAAVTSGPNVIYKATKNTINRVQYIVKEIKAALNEDEEKRNKGETVGFANAIPSDKLMTLTVDQLFLKLKKFTLEMDSIEESNSKEKQTMDDESDENSSMDEEVVTVVTDGKIAALVPKKKNKKGGASPKEWAKMSSDEDVSAEDEKHEEDVEIVKVITAEDRIVAKIHVSSDSEEEDVVILKPEVIKKSKKKKNKTKS